MFHNDHLRYLIAGKDLCRHLVVGITNPDPTRIRDDPADPQRSLPQENPLTYFERYTLVTTALWEAGVPHSELSIVPFPINLPGLYRYYLPLEATFFLTIYDQWGRRKLKQFQTIGLITHVIWEKSLQEKGLSAGDIRRRMAEGRKWTHMVPSSTRKLMKQWGIPERIRGLYHM